MEQLEKHKRKLSTILKRKKELEDEIIEARQSIDLNIQQAAVTPEVLESFENEEQGKKEEVAELESEAEQLELDLQLEEDSEVDTKEEEPQEEEIVEEEDSKTVEYLKKLEDAQTALAAQVEELGKFIDKAEEEQVKNIKAQQKAVAEGGKKMNKEKSLDILQKAFNFSAGNKAYQASDFSDTNVVDVDEDTGTLFFDRDRFTYDNSRRVEPLRELVYNYKTNDESGDVIVPSANNAVATKTGDYGSLDFSKAAQQAYTTIPFKVEEYGILTPYNRKRLAKANINLIGQMVNNAEDAITRVENLELVKEFNKFDDVDVASLDDIIEVLDELASEGYNSLQIVASVSAKTQLGTLKDKNGRYLLIPDPQSTIDFTFDGHPLRIFPKSVFDDNVFYIFAQEAIAFVEGDKLRQEWVRPPYSPHLEVIGLYEDFDVVMVNKDAGRKFTVNIPAEEDTTP